MPDIEQLYDAVQAVTDELAENQPWWPCLNCPVAKDPNNCCHKAMFHVTRTEWEHLRQHPFIQSNRERLVKNARRRVQRLREGGYDVRSWSATIAQFSSGTEFTCPLFNNQTGRCNVYENRPLICRTYGVSHPTLDGAVFGCSLVTQAVAEHVDQHVQFVPLDQINQYASTIFEAPSKPIVAWLAEEKL